ncbi:hypothetical protein [Archangium violaceum]|uniref:hypothetical protein n=1 Tax=Archangium violaceum TaxID=83451 RepID=UPI001EF0819D|nr:hypothetical protein [Archangium violaceum]
MVELLQARLTRRGFTVTSLTDPNAALPLVMEQPFDVVLTDLNMKGLTSSTSLMSRAVASGVYDYVPLPLDPTDLVRKVGRALRSRR